MIYFRLLGMFFLFMACTLQAAEPAGASLPTLKACQDEVAAALALNIGNYKKDLQMLMREFQSAGDLDSYLAVKDEIARFEKNPQIPSGNLVKEPELLAILQGSHRSAAFIKTNEIVVKNLGVLLPRQRALTKSGKIEEALAVRAVVRSIQSAYKESFDWVGSDNALFPVYKVSGASLVMGFTKMPDVASRLFGGRRLLVEGTIDRFDQDFSNGTHFNVFMKDGEESQTLVQFVFKTTDVSVSRSRIKGVEAVTFTKKGDATKGPFSMKAGMKMQVEGQCEGKHIHVNMVDVAIPDSYWPVVKPDNE